MNAMLRALAGLTAAMMLILGTGGVARADVTQSVAISIPIEKKITGRTPEKAEEFTFVLSPVNNAPMPESGEAKITGAGTGAFAPITYTIPGDYLYTIRETAGSAAGYTYDSTVYHVTVQVVSDDNGKLFAAAYISADGASGKTDAAVFSNRYRNNADIPKTGYEGMGTATRMAIFAALCAAAAMVATLKARQRKRGCAKR